MNLFNKDIKFLALGIFIISAVIGSQISFSLSGSQLAAVDGPNIPPSITITKPTTGVTQQVGIDKTITWTTVNVPTGNPMYLKLFTEGGQYIPEASGGLVFGIGNNDGIYELQYPATIPHGRYYLELDTANVGGVNVPADITGVFYITHKTNININSPAEGAIWPINSGQEINWTANVPGGEDLKLEKLDASGNLVGSAINTPNDGKHLIPTVTGPAGQYRYRLTFHSSDSNIQDVVGTSGVFNIVAAQTTYNLDITEPISTDVWIPGTQRFVRWTTNLPDFEKFKLERIRVSDDVVVATNANLPNTGSFLVTVIPSTPGQFKYRLSSQLRPDPVATSANFTIGTAPPQTPTINITSDLSGKQYLVGSLVKLTWGTNSAIPTSADTPSTAYPRMLFRLFKSSGVAVSPPITPIVQGGNDGNQTITLPSGAMPGDYYIEVDAVLASGSGGVNVPAVKTGVFKIISSVTDPGGDDNDDGGDDDSDDDSGGNNSGGSKSVRMTYPNGGEIILTNKAHKFTWVENNISSNATRSLRILDPNNSSTIIKTVTATTSRSYTWRAGDIPPGTYKVELIVTTSGQIVTDRTNGSFAMVAPAPVTTTPSSNPGASSTSSSTLRAVQFEVKNSSGVSLAGAEVIVTLNGYYLGSRTTDSSGKTPIIALEVGPRYIFSIIKNGFRGSGIMSLVVPPGVGNFISGPWSLTAYQTASAPSSQTPATTPTSPTSPPPPPVIVTTSPTDADPRIFVTAPIAGVEWKAGSRHLVTWDTQDIPDGNLIFMRLKTVSGQLIPDAINLNQGNNDGQESVSLASNVAPDIYYVELDTHKVEGVTVPLANSEAFVVVASDSQTINPSPTLTPVSEIPIKPASAVPTTWVIAWLSAIVLISGSIIVVIFKY